MDSFPTIWRRLLNMTEVVERCELSSWSWDHPSWHQGSEHLQLDGLLKKQRAKQIDGTTRRVGRRGENKQQKARSGLVLLRVFFESMKCERYPSLKLTWLLKIGLPKRKAVSLPPFFMGLCPFCRVYIFDNLTEWLWGVRWVKCIGSLLIKMSGKQSRSVKGVKT